MSADDPAELWKLNQRLLTRVLHAATPQLTDLGLDTKEFFVLAEVDACRYPAALATELMLPRASITSYVRTLVAAGLVRREIDETDLRRHRLATTEEGRAVLTGALGALAAEFSTMLERVPADDRRELTRILQELLAEDGD